MQNVIIYSPLIGFACFILAAVFIYVWPKSRAREIKTLNLPQLCPALFPSAGLGTGWHGRLYVCKVCQHGNCSHWAGHIGLCHVPLHLVAQIIQAADTTTKTAG